MQNKQSWVMLNDRLINKATGPIDEELQEAVVKDFVVNKDQDWKLLAELLPIDIVRRVQAIAPPDPDVGSDVLGWSNHHEEYFSIKGAYISRFLV